jgi:hypothetical protein
MLLRQLTGIQYLANLGGFWVAPDLSDPERGWGYVYNSSKEGEFHAWIARGTEYIDLTARHWPQLFAERKQNFQTPLLPWNRPDIGELVWLDTLEEAERLCVTRQTHTPATRAMLLGEGVWMDFLVQCRPLYRAALAYFESRAKLVQPS